MKKNNKKGFTLVELVIVVAVMAVLVAVAIPTVGSIVKSAQDSTNESNARTIESMVKLYMAEEDASFSAGTVRSALLAAKLGIDNGEFEICSCGECFPSEAAVSDDGREAHACGETSPTVVEIVYENGALTTPAAS